MHCHGHIGLSRYVAGSLHWFCTYKLRSLINIDFIYNIDWICNSFVPCTIQFEEWNTSFEKLFYVQCTVTDRRSVHNNADIIHSFIIDSKRS